VSDQQGDGSETPAELERELEELEGRIESATTPTKASRSRLRRLNRQVREAAPDALFSAEGGFTFRGIARRTDSYGFVLLLLAVLIWFFVPFASSERWATIPTITVFFLTILISMHTSFVRERWLRLVLAIDVGLLLLGIAGVITGNEEVRAVSNAGFGLLLFATALVVLRRVLGHQTVTSRTLSGAVSAFLFVGLAFACFAEATVLHEPHAYNAASGNFGFGSMLYFSFVTIATLGYGDIVPVSSAARSLATMEAIMGQIYLVTIVARLVSLLGMGRLAAASGTSSATDDQSQ
jgi:hypothetical protein